MNTTTPGEVVDADVVADPTTNQPETGADVLLNLEQLIKSNIAGVDQRKSQLKKQREMLESALQNDETYRMHDEASKKAAKVKGQTKAQILQQPANKQLVEKVKDLAIEIKEMDGALSDYLREYQRMSGVNEIETDDGQVREIVYVAKLVKKSERGR